MKNTPNNLVLDWIQSQEEESLFLSVMTIGEIEKGISRLPISRRKDELTIWIQSLIYRFEMRILTINIEIIRHWGNLVGTLEKKGRVLPLNDSLIAATALVNNLTIVTRNEKDFEKTNCKVLNIWND
jgi:toxin FitB